VTPIRYSLPFHKGNRFLVMPSLSDNMEIVGLKTVTFAPNNPGIGKKTITGFVTLIDYENGDLLSLLEGSYLTKIRTGVISGVATKHLSKKSAKSLSVIGTGDQAEGLVKAILAVRDIKKIHIFNRTYEKAKVFLEKMKSEYNIECELYDTADDAVSNGEIIITCTNSNTPVFNSNLKKGVHVNAVGSFKPDMQELPSHVLTSADSIIVESKEAALEETGDLKIPLEKNELSEDQVTEELGNIISQNLKIRQNDDDITVFKSVGLAIVDIAVANYFYKKALQNNVGIHVSF
ncbi:ornithine cyclodeaminase family protein, partial [Staphylococcus gallinarum]|uniref:ornithine cyclodeaminase family protein n=2 Tax=Staphylococcus TaxID=1279 RepID=UPI000D1CE580